MNLLGPGFGATEPPTSIPDQAGLRIKSLIGIKILLESGFGAKEPPPGTPDHRTFNNHQSPRVITNGWQLRMGSSNPGNLDGGQASPSGQNE